jgi:nucleotide-binding universal stress UspA family protein
VLPQETASNPDAKELSEPIRRTMIHEIESRLKPFSTDFVIDWGDTAETILRVAREKKADLIAMGIRGAFLAGFNPRASVAYRVITASYCPVVTCR